MVSIMTEQKAQRCQEKPKLEPANVAEVHTVRQQVVLGEHTQAELQCTGVVGGVCSLEMQDRADCLLEIELLNVVEFVVVVERGAYYNEFDTYALVAQGISIQDSLKLECVASILYP